VEDNVTAKGPRALLEELVRIPSVSPSYTDDATIAGEQRIAEYVAAYLAERNFEIIMDEAEPGRPNLVATHGSDDASQTLLVEAHLDTVGVAGMTRSPFVLTEEDGRLYGRGACDTKGPLAAALWAMQPDVLAALSARGWRLVFVGAMGEEEGNRGAERLVERGLVRADEALILEPTELAVVHAHKGALWFEVEVKGRAGHGSAPDRGLSAIEGMQRVIQWLQQDTRAAPVPAHPALGEPTVNIGRIEGGMATNVIPDRCRIQVDRRSLPAERHEDLLQRIREELERLQVEGGIHGFALRVLKDSPPFETSADTRLARRLAESSRRVGVDVRTAGTSWFSDAGPLSRVCDHVVVFGPGSIREAHTAEEYIDLQSLQTGSDILLDLLQHLGEAKDV
jgi:acetylornithine deacetylase ArgE